MKKGDYLVFTFKTPMQFLGRNGSFAMTGLEIFALPDCVRLSPVTSKGHIGACYLEVPYDAEVLGQVAEVFSGFAQGSTIDQQVRVYDDPNKEDRFTIVLPKCDATITVREDGACQHFAGLPDDESILGRQVSFLDLPQQGQLTVAADFDSNLLGKLIAKDGRVRKGGLMFEEVTEEIDGEITQSNLRVATEEEIEEAERLFQEGNCPHTIVFDDPGGVYDYRFCHTCGICRGVV